MTELQAQASTDSEIPWVVLFFTSDGIPFARECRPAEDAFELVKMWAEIAALTMGCKTVQIMRECGHDDPTPW